MTAQMIEVAFSGAGSMFGGAKVLTSLPSEHPFYSIIGRVDELGSWRVS
jgi:hypothetical protein